MNLDFSEEETNRLSAILDSAPGPTPWDSKYYPNFIGPNGSELFWSQDENLTTLVSKADGETYLALGTYCYVKKPSVHPADRMIEWHEIRNEYHIPQCLQVNLIDTRSLAPISQQLLDERAPKGPHESPREQAFDKRYCFFERDAYEFQHSARPSCRNQQL